MPESGRREKIVRLLEQVGLDEDCVNRFPHEFSGGQRQRMSLARALAPDPDIIVCDEPVSSLDASVQAQVLNLLKDNQDRLNLSYLFISHDLAVVNHMSDKIAVMYAGSIVEAGPAAEIFRNPRHPYARELLSASCGEAGAAGEQEPVRPPGDVSALSRSCAFLRRCPDIGPLCANNFPELKPVADKNFDPGHLVRC
jgi:oligopeptide/dipeptide ABC transporter ATP-binding protein